MTEDRKGRARLALQGLDQTCLQAKSMDALMQRLEEVNTEGIYESEKVEEEKYCTAALRIIFGHAKRLGRSYKIKKNTEKVIEAVCSNTGNPTED